MTRTSRSESSDVIGYAADVLITEVLVTGVLVTDVLTQQVSP